MKRSVTVALLALLSVLLPPAPADAAQAAPVVTRRQRVVDGLRHEAFRVNLGGGAVARGNVVRVARNGRLRVEPKHAGGSIPALRTVPRMAARELPRGGLAAINGGFWLPAAGGKPHGVAATDRVLFSGPRTQWGRPGHRGTLGFQGDGRAIFSRLGGELTLVGPDGTSAGIDDLNYVPLSGSGGGLLLYTPPWDAPVHAPRGSTVAVLERLTLPLRGTAGATVHSVRATSGSIAIPPGGAILVGYGRARNRLAGIAAGDTVRVEVGIRPLDVSADAWTKSIDALPGGPLIVRDGHMTPPRDWVAEGFSHHRHNGPRHPRTAVGVTRTGAMLLVTVDGRQAHSAGMTMWELAALMIDLGAHHALSLDGGGSTTMTVLGRVRNRISDPVPRPVASALVVRYRPDLPTRDPGRNACPAGSVPRTRFADIAGSAHEATIACAAWYGLTTGRTTSRFAPDRPVTRAQMASFLARLIDHSVAHGDGDRRGRALPGRTRRFSDVPARSPHAHAIGRLAAAGIIAGGPGTLADTAFGPHQPIDRGQMATLLARTIAHVRGNALPGGRDVFADDAGTTHEAAINTLARAGIVQGTSPGLYAPGAPVRRGAMASFLQRTMELLVASGTTRPPTDRPPS
jgi:Phosphodiester glycosidase/S-layer homology domain